MFEMKLYFHRNLLSWTEVIRSKWAGRNFEWGLSGTAAVAMSDSVCVWYEWYWLTLTVQLKKFNWSRFNFMFKTSNSFYSGFIYNYFFLLRFIIKRREVITIISVIVSIKKKNWIQMVCLNYFQLNKDSKNQIDV